MLTNAIFNYSPCKDLLILCKNPAFPEKWATDQNKWLALSADPYPIVSKHVFNCCTFDLLVKLILFEKCLKPEENDSNCF